MSHVTLALIGAGDRGFAYGKYALDHPDEVRFVAVADPIAVRRDRFTRPGHRRRERFADWCDLLGGPRLARRGDRRRARPAARPARRGRARSGP